jgi:hypothetical protein
MYNVQYKALHLLLNMSTVLKYISILESKNSTHTSKGVYLKEQNTARFFEIIIE